MPQKKSQSKTTPKPAKEEAKVAGPGKPSASKRGSEIDDIFAGKKRKKVEAQTEKPAGEIKAAKSKSKKIRAKNGFDGFGESEAKARKRTEDGLAVYTEEELGISRSDAGATPLCPFDCSCCF